MYANIRAALDKLLYDYAATVPISVAWQNMPFTPGSDAYLEAMLLPAETDIVGMESTGSNDYIGIYQINVVCPKGTGTAESRTLVDGVLTALKRTTSYTVNSQKVISQKAWASPALDRDSSWYIIPISVEYRSFNANA